MIFRTTCVVTERDVRTLAMQVPSRRYSTMTTFSRLAKSSRDCLVALRTSRASKTATLSNSPVSLSFVVAMFLLLFIVRSGKDLHCWPSGKGVPEGGSCIELGESSSQGLRRNHPDPECRECRLD